MRHAERRALVTGGAGFIGSELTSQLVAGGWRVVVLDDLSTGHRHNLEDVPAGAVEIVVGDVRDRRLVGALASRVDVIFHLACLGVRHSLAAPRANADVNATGTLVVLEAARAARVARVVHVSSSEVYGTARAVPMAEDHPTEPTTVYGASKLAGESYARAYHGSFGLPVAIVRPFNAFGPRAHHEGMSGELIPRFVLRALAGRPLVIFGDGGQSRDFTYVADTARAIRLAAETPGAVGETLNVGAGREITVDALARRIAAAIGCDGVVVRHDAPRPGDVRRLRADAARAERVLGYRPTVDLTEGLRRTVAWYRQHAVDPEKLVAQEVERAWERTVPRAHAG